MQENYLAKWLNNELTEEELAAFKESDEYTSYQRIIKASDSLNGPDFDMENALEAVKNKRTLHESKVVQLKPFRRFLQVAAAVMIIMIGSYFYLNTLDESFSTQYAQNEEVILPDSSKIILNADSEISFNPKKWDKKRNVTLKGEAFFKVAKGKRFTVATDHGTVAVLGTQFNVENRKGFFEVTCFEGLVGVTYNGKETKLPAGTSFMVVDGNIVASETPKSSTPSWLNKESTFKSIPLKYVLAEFQRQHDIQVETQNIDLGKLFTGTFSNTNTDLALQSISVPSQLQFKLDGKKVLFYAESAP
ncbi:FecR family protein [Maribacter polysiphoniae]|uniref:FecR family protein n=1 Tax=Maribacter polysiphoniae TaxID=429344 RepID=A0A316E3M6_9FLAO|nr:FecR family protein [Maribacter polysiphoniae]MBD1259446.1 FecR family protein [Maribacter polysiphoniae]PWK25011.1 FecR family protein [Maribacter polysiphoniae]